MIAGAVTTNAANTIVPAVKTIMQLQMLLLASLVEKKNKHEKIIISMILLISIAD